MIYLWDGISEILILPFQWPTFFCVLVKYNLCNTNNAVSYLILCMMNYWGHCTHAILILQFQPYFFQCVPDHFQGDNQSNRLNLFICAFLSPQNIFWEICIWILMCPDQSKCAWVTSVSYVSDRFSSSQCNIFGYVLNWKFAFISEKIDCINHTATHYLQKYDNSNIHSPTKRCIGGGTHVFLTSG